MSLCFRTTRWLDRCLKAHANPSTQNIFPIVQGTLYEDLRQTSASDLIKRNVNGYAIGGLRYFPHIYQLCLIKKCALTIIEVVQRLYCSKSYNYFP